MSAPTNLSLLERKLRDGILSYNDLGLIVNALKDLNSGGVGSGNGSFTWGLGTGNIADQVDLQALLGITPENISGATTLNASALNKIYDVTGTVTDFTIDLPTAVGNSGAIIFKGNAALTKVVTIQGVLGQLIDGESERKISTCGSIAVLIKDGAWIVTSEVGSWIPYLPVVAGFTSDPTFDRTIYFRTGKLVTVAIHAAASGTSSAVTKTITLPFVADSMSVQLGITGPNINNAVVDSTYGMIVTRLGSNIADIYRNPASLAWTAANSVCRINIGGFQYKMA
jgi:hypothetical protein